VARRANEQTRTSVGTLPLRRMRPRIPRTCPTAHAIIRDSPLLVSTPSLVLHRSRTFATVVPAKRLSVSPPLTVRWPGTGRVGRSGTSVSASSSCRTRWSGCPPIRGVPFWASGTAHTKPVRVWKGGS